MTKEEEGWTCSVCKQPFDERDGSCDCPRPAAPATWTCDWCGEEKPKDTKAFYGGLNGPYGKFCSEICVHDAHFDPLSE